MTWIRVLAAAGLSLVFPGAGHAYLKDWIRALLFAGMFISAVLIFLPTSELAAAETMGEATDLIVSETDTISQFALSFVVIFAVMDAALRASGLSPNGSAGSDGPSCPHCGKELDEDLEFCHWCTTKLDQPNEEATN